MFPVEVYPPLKDKLTHPVAILQRMVVDTGGQGPLKLVKKNDEKTVSTCLQYQQAVVDGYAITSNYDLSVASFYMLWCASLEWLEQAKPAKTSAFKQFDLIKAYGQLPSHLVFSLATKPNNVRPLNKQFSDVTVVEAKSYSVMVESKKAGQRAVINVLAKADLSGNGQQDLLFSVADYAIGGSYRHYAVYAVTRAQPQEPLVEVKAPNHGLDT